MLFTWSRSSFYDKNIWIIIQFPSFIAILQNLDRIKFDDLHILQTTVGWNTKNVKRIWCTVGFVLPVPLNTCLVLLSAPYSGCSSTSEDLSFSCKNIIHCFLLMIKEYLFQISNGPCFPSPCSTAKSKKRCVLLSDGTSRCVHFGITVLYTRLHYYCSEWEGR